MADWYGRYRQTFGRGYGRHGSSQLGGEGGYYDTRPLEAEAEAEDGDLLLLTAPRPSPDGRVGGGGGGGGGALDVRPMDHPPPVRRTAGLSTVWRWEIPPPEVFEEGPLAASLGWVDCEPLPSGGEEGEGAAAGTAAAASSLTFDVRTLTRPGFGLGFGGAFPYDEFCRPQEDVLYAVARDDDDDDDDDASEDASGSGSGSGFDDGATASSAFSTLHYAWERSWDGAFADFQGPRARQTFGLYRRSSGDSYSSDGSGSRIREEEEMESLTLLSSVEGVDPTPEQRTRAIRMHEDARHKARLLLALADRSVADRRGRPERSPAEEERAELRRRRGFRIDEIAFSDGASVSTRSIDCEDVSLPGILKTMAKDYDEVEARVRRREEEIEARCIEEEERHLQELRSQSRSAPSSGEIAGARSRGAAIRSGVEAANLAFTAGEKVDAETHAASTNASTSEVEGVAFISDASTSTNLQDILQRHNEEDWPSMNRKDVVLGLDGLEEDSREDSTDLELFLDDTASDDGDASLNFSEGSAKDSQNSFYISEPSVGTATQSVQSASNEAVKNTANTSYDRIGASPRREEASSMPTNVDAMHEDTRHMARLLLAMADRRGHTAEQPTREEPTKRKATHGAPVQEEKSTVDGAGRDFGEELAKRAMHSIGEQPAKPKATAHRSPIQEKKSTVAGTGKDFGEELAKRAKSVAVKKERGDGGSSEKVAPCRWMSPTDNEHDLPTVPHAHVQKVVPIPASSQSLGERDEPVVYSEPENAAETSRNLEPIPEEPASAENSSIPSSSSLNDDPTRYSLAHAILKAKNDRKAALLSGSSAGPRTPPRTSAPVSGPSPRSPPEKTARVSLDHHFRALEGKWSPLKGSDNSARTLETENSTNPSEDLSLSLSPSGSSAASPRIGADARSKRRALEARWATRQALKSPSKQATQSSQSLEAAIRQSLQQTGYRAIRTEDVNEDAMDRIRAERERVAARSQAMRAMRT